MTAYGRATSTEIGDLSWVVEIHSVNRRGLDIHLHISKELLFMDIDLRKAISKEVARGQVTLKISFKKLKGNESSITMLKKLKSFWEKGAKELGYPKESVDLPFLLDQMDRTPIEEFGLSEKKIQTELKKALSEAMDAFITMKEVEGKALALDIKGRIKAIGEHLKKIEKEAKGAPQKYREKLLEKLEDVLAGAADDERLLKEVAFYAEKIDITEEITRLKSHMKQALDLIASKEKSIGRSLDFLNQEMLREINTIASKSGSLSVTKEAVNAKAELEKIREQVQNIE